MPRSYTKKQTNEGRFLSFVQVASDGCWLWKGHVHPNGYGQFYMDGRQGYAHRASYQIHRGNIPDDLVIDHLCRNRACVNPAHLETGPQQVNIRRGVAPSAMLANVNKCKNGHPFLEANTHYSKEGKRQCRICLAEWARNKRRQIRERDNTHA